MTEDSFILRSRIPRALHQRLQRHRILSGVRQQDVVRQALEDHLDRLEAARRRG